MASLDAIHEEFKRGKAQNVLPYPVIFAFSPPKQSVFGGWENRETRGGSKIHEKETVEAATIRAGRCLSEQIPPTACQRRAPGARL